MNNKQLKRLRNKKKQKKLQNVIKNNSPKEFDPFCQINKYKKYNIYEKLFIKNNLQNIN